MSPKGYSSLFKDINPFFYRSMPKASVLFTFLFALGVITGIAAVALLNFGMMGTRLLYSAVNGATMGILVITLPALLTVILIKTMKRYVPLKYIFFLSIIGAISYALFILLGSTIYLFYPDYAFACAIILVGDASIFCWWFFVAKVVLGQKKKAALFALVHPTLNVLLYIPYSKFIFAYSAPMQLLLLKLYAGIFVFLLVSYAIMLVFDKPLEKGLDGFKGVEAFSQMLQNWLFDMNTSSPLGGKFGVPQDISADTITLRDRKGALKAIFFAPDIHYGPFGTLAGSNFPYLLGRYSELRYKVPTFIIHGPINIDNNPVSVSQFKQLTDTLDNAVKAPAEAADKAVGMLFSKSTYKTSTVIRLWLGRAQLVTFTRAPRVTEDIAPEAALIFRRVIEHGGAKAVLIDAHNSRYESAPKSEIDGIGPHSYLLKEYIRALELSEKPQHRCGSIKAGACSMELFNSLGKPNDLARGNLNVAAFSFNGFRFVMLHFNSNNILPNLRNEIVDHVRRKFRTEAEVYTTDTHAVNSLGFNESNVLGRYVNQKKLVELAGVAVGRAFADMAEVRVCHRRSVMKNFVVWGPNAKEKITAVASSAYATARIIVPMVVAVGFVAAAWIILIV